MRALRFMLLATSLVVILCACKERRATAVTGDACSLLSKDEVGSVQAVQLNETKSSGHLDGNFRISQCLYTAAEFSKSVSLALIQRDPTQQGTRSPKDFWKEKFDPYENEEPKTNRDDEKEKGPAAKKIVGLGDEAYWVANRFGGILYVLKGDAFISIGIGGTADEETKLKKSKVLAKKALGRL
jgi:hypothetical protein